MLPLVGGVAGQPLSVLIIQLRKALTDTGRPLSEATAAALDTLLEGPLDENFSLEVQRLLDPLCLVGIEINPEARVSVREGPAARQLDQKGWTTFLVKVHNIAGVTSALRAESAEALPIAGSPIEDIERRWLQMAFHDDGAMHPTLSGLLLEYRILSLYSRDAGTRAATITFDAGKDTRGLGSASDITLVYQIEPARKVGLLLRDGTGWPVVAALLVRDPQGRVYPPQLKRLAPDFSFQPQVYRGDGDELLLPDGTYTVTCTRGPEYLPVERVVTVTAATQTLEFELERWVDPSALGWWSGDHHMHAAGCKHYTNPTKGVLARDMVRHCRGEDLNVGCNLTWGPCFDYQSQFFSGMTDPESIYPYLLRYDVEVSGFGSHKSGHLCLLNLLEQIPPGGNSTEHWPTLGLNCLRWAKAQGAVCGSAHSALGLHVDTDELPNYIIPPYDGIGANELIVDVTHVLSGPDGLPVPAVDFFSVCSTNAVPELNMWYHMLNCGFELRAAGETDFPCIEDDRLGMGRSYVKIDGALSVEGWFDGLKKGRSYVSDGRSHLIGFTVGNREAGSGDGWLRLGSPGTVTVQAQVAALLGETTDPSVSRRFDEQPYWHLEKARLSTGRTVRVEVIVNGEPVAQLPILADGVLRPVTFSIELDHSSWVACRILPSSHTNPVFVEVAGQPIRASSQSAQWCLDGVEQCWSQKAPSYAPLEFDQATRDYEHARRTYRRILAESIRHR